MTLKQNKNPLKNSKFPPLFPQKRPQIMPRGSFVKFGDFFLYFWEYFWVILNSNYIPLNTFKFTPDMSDSHEHAALSIIRICSIRSSTDLFETSLNESAKLTLFSLNSVKFKF